MVKKIVKKKEEEKDFGKEKLKKVVKKEKKIIKEKDDNLFKNSKNFLFFGLVIISFGIIIYPYFTVIAFSLLTVYFVYPLYKTFLKKFNSAFSIIFTWLSLILIILIPSFVIGSVIFGQVKTMVSDASNYVEDNKESFLSNLDLKSDSENKIVRRIYSEIEKNKGLVDEIINTGTSLAKNMGQKVIKFSTDKLAQLPNLIMNLLLFMFITSSILINGKKLRKTVKGILPLDGNVFDLYEKRIGFMTSSVIKGNFVISLIQSVGTTLSFILAGLPYSGIVFILSFFLYFPMIGSFPLFIPATIYLAVKGQYLMAAFIFIFNSIIISNVDNLLRGRFTPKEANIESSLMILSVLSGVSIFGLMGILYGPIITVIGLTSIKIYLELKEKK